MDAKLRWWSKTVLATAATVLAFGVGLVLYGEFRPLAEPRFGGDVASMLPTAADVPGWEVKQEDIAATPEMKRAVTELLSFSDAVSVNYVKGSERISVYIAYWQPGKMSHRLVAGHTPDVCWVGAGWQRASARVSDPLPGPQGVAVVPAEEREMRKPNAGEWVLFWHLVGDKRISYGAGLPPWHAAISDTLRWGLNQREEQFFIRISSSRPVSAWWQSDVVQGLIANLKQRKVAI